ncbi:hypothetical protein J6590_102989, partial [Homalodisca vitripennis]
MSAEQLLYRAIHPSPAIVRSVDSEPNLQRAYFTCLYSSPTTSLCDGYLGTHTGRRTPSTTSPLGLHITAST